jgi:hypothetical protein
MNWRSNADKSEARTQAWSHRSLPAVATSTIKCAIKPHLGALYQGDVGAETRERKKERQKQGSGSAALNRFSPIVSIP